MCYGEISGIDRDYHDYPESTIAQKVIFESSLWMSEDFEPSQNHLRTISQPSQLSQYQSAWSLVWLTTTSGPEKCLQMPCNIFYIQVDLKNRFFLSKSAKTISKPSQPSQNHLKPSQPISVFLQMIPGTFYKPEKYSEATTNVFCIPIEFKNMKIHQKHLRTISQPSQTISDHLKTISTVSRAAIFISSGTMLATKVLRGIKQCVLHPIELKNMKIHQNHLRTIS